MPSPRVSSSLSLSHQTRKIARWEKSDESYKKYVKFNENFRSVSLSPESDQAGVAVLINEALGATEALHTFIHTEFRFSCFPSVGHSLIFFSIALLAAIIHPVLLHVLKKGVGLAF